MTTGEKIAQLRRARGMSQEALADTLGLSRQAVSKWEAGQASPGRENLVELARLFEVSTDELLQPDRTEPPMPRPGSREIPPAAPTASRRKRAAHIAAAVAAAAAAVWLTALTAWLAVLTNRLALLEGRIAPPQTVVVAPEQPEEPSALLEYRIERRYDPDSDTVRLSLRAVPRTRAEGESAVFTVKGARASLRADAAWADGAYTATLSAPVEDGLSAYLLLTGDAQTRTEPVGTLSLAQEYRIRLSCGWEGRATRMGGAGGKLYLDGRVLATVWPSAPDETGGIHAWPVSGAATLYADGEPVQYEELSIEEAIDWEAGETADEMTVFTPFHTDVAEKQAYIEVCVRDNYGREYTDRIDFPDADA